MVQINFARREIACKIVYYGPGMSGKTTNLEIIHKKVPDMTKGQMTSIATEGDRTLFFDLLPLDLGEVAGMKTKMQLYTVPGQVYYNSTRKLVLQGADGLVFVADSGGNRMADNIESLENLAQNLNEYGLDIATTPLVLQYNKRDLSEVLSVEELNTKLNKWGCPYFEAVAFKGDGVMPTLKAISKMVIEKLNKEMPQRSAAPAPVVSRPVEQPAPAGVAATRPAPAPVVREPVAAHAMVSPPAEFQPAADIRPPSPPPKFEPPVHAPPPPRVETPRPLPSPLVRPIPTPPTRGETSGSRATASKSKGLIIGVIVAVVIIILAILILVVLR